MVILTFLLLALHENKKIRYNNFRHSKVEHGGLFWMLQRSSVQYIWADSAALQLFGADSIAKNYFFFDYVARDLYLEEENCSGRYSVALYWTFDLTGHSVDFGACSVATLSYNESRTITVTKLKRLFLYKSFFS